MRADPNPDKAPHEKTFAGDNALRQGGEFDHWMQVTQYTVMEAEKGSSSHLQAAPTQAVLAHEAFKRKKAQLAEQSKADVEAKYGNAAAGKPDEELLLPSSEAYVEYDHTYAPVSFFSCSGGPVAQIPPQAPAFYAIFLALAARIEHMPSGLELSCTGCLSSPLDCNMTVHPIMSTTSIVNAHSSMAFPYNHNLVDVIQARLSYEHSTVLSLRAQAACDCRGKLVRGQEHVASSRYEEDLFPLDHTSVWGSFWKDGKWGYACCKSFTRNSMCLGHKAEAVIATNAANMAANAERIHSERIAHNSAALDTSQNHAGVDCICFQEIVCELAYVCLVVSLKISCTT
jgi:hypothetical protein